MRQVTRTVAAALAVVMAMEGAALAVSPRGPAYFGGTVSTFGNPKDPVEGRLDTSDEKALVFFAKDDEFLGKSFTIPWKRIEDLEYGQKAGRRVGAAIGTTVLLGPIGLVSLFSKKRKHFLTVSFKDQDNKGQVVVLELGKDVVRTTLAIVEARSGKEIAYQDDEAKKSGK